MVAPAPPTTAPRCGAVVFSEWRGREGLIEDGGDADWRRQQSPTRLRIPATPKLLTYSDMGRLYALDPIEEQAKTAPVDSCRISAPLCRKNALASFPQLVHM